MENSNGQGSKVSRRDFLKTSAVAAGAVAAGLALPRAYAQSSDKIKVGLIGCGGRGSDALNQCVSTSENVIVYALGDLFEDRMKGNFNRWKDKKDKADIVPDRCFVGFDAYKKVVDSGVDMVILATPPGFRPDHLAYAIEKGKHVFMEKPVAVDPAGIRKVIAASQQAKEKKLAIVAGTQRRHEAVYLATMKAIQDGTIGEMVGGQCYWNQGFLWVNDRKEGQDDMTWQCRNWLYFTWLSGDHIVEQHVHNIDVINWAFGGPPTKAYGMGGREVRKGDRHGNIFDHHAIEFTYPNGAKVLSMCRQIKGCADRVTEYFVGTRGRGHAGQLYDHGGKEIWKFEGGGRNPYEQEHIDLIASIRKGEPLNEGVRIAESTLTAILGRMSTYSGRELSFDWALKNSKLDLVPKDPKFGDLPVRPVPIPGDKDSWKVWCY